MTQIRMRDNIKCKYPFEHEPLEPMDCQWKSYYHQQRKQHHMPHCAWHFHTSHLDLERLPTGHGRPDRLHCCMKDQHM